MARHVDPDDRSFRNSLLRAAAGGVAALVVTVAITGVLSALGRDDAKDSPAMVLTGTPAPVEEDTQPPPSPEPEPTAVSEAPPVTETATPMEMTEGGDGLVTVQVLDAVGTGPAAQAAADALTELGYEVVVVNSTPRRVETTTVLYTPGHREDAEALQEADERFVEVRENKAFNPSVNLHVLVGPDFQP